MFKVTKKILYTLLLMSIVPTSTWAINIKGKLPGGVDEVTASAIVAEGETVERRTDRKNSRNFRLSVSGTDSRLFFTNDNSAVPVILGVYDGDQVLTVKQAINQGLCNDEGVVGLMAFKKNVGGIKRATFGSIKDGDNVKNYYLKNIRFLVGGLRNRIEGFVDNTIQADLNEDCSTTGNALSLGMGAVGGSSVGIAAESVGDIDADGMPDELDVDVDGDSVLNNYDDDYVSDPETTFPLFSNFKVDIENTINSNVTLPSEEQIASTLETRTLAIGVLATADTDESSELDCGSLNYCSEGGTGATGNPVQEFPEEFDTDSDGLGTIERGGTGDFQLQTNAGSDDITAGDLFTQIVNDGEGHLSEFFASLTFIFESTPAITEVIVNDGDASESTYNAVYPVESGNVATFANPIPVTNNIDGDVVLTITSFRPQRAGITEVGEGEVMNIGNSRVLVDIPNGPNNSGPGTGGCEPTAYSTSDVDLSLEGDTLADAQDDFDNATGLDGDGNKTLTFTVNISDCLAEVSQTLASGDKLKIDLQYKNSVGDNAAQAFYIQMQ